MGGTRIASEHFCPKTRRDEGFREGNRKWKNTAQRNGMEKRGLDSSDS